MKKEEIVNNLIQKEKLDTNLISDGHHTFHDMYNHRNELFITLCRWIANRSLIEVWRFQVDADWFLLGIKRREGDQITYHLPMSRWKDTEFAYTCSDRPKFDVHSPEDVLARLSALC